MEKAIIEKRIINESAESDLRDQFKDKLIDIYDINEYVKKITNNVWESFIMNEAAIIVTDFGSGVIVDYEGIGNQFSDLDEVIEIALAHPAEEEVQPDGSVLKSMPMYPEAKLKITPRSIIKDAPNHQELAEDFFSKCYGSNWRCSDNLDDVLRALKAKGYFSNEDVVESVKEKSAGEKIAKLVADIFAGDCGPFGEEDPILKGNRMGLYSQNPTIWYTFNDNGSIDIDYSEDDQDLEDTMPTHYKNLRDLFLSDDGWFYFQYDARKDDIEKLLKEVEDILAGENDLIENKNTQLKNVIDNLVEELDTLNIDYSILDEEVDEITISSVINNKEPIIDVVNDYFKDYKLTEDNDNIYLTLNKSVAYKPLKEDYERITKAQEEWLDKKIEEHNFSIVSKRDYGFFDGPKTDVHYQIISNEGNKTKYDLEKEAEWIDNLLDVFEGKTGSPCTYNMGLQDDGFISCGFDCRATSQKYKDVTIEEKEPESVFEPIVEDWKAVFVPEVGDKVIVDKFYVSSGRGSLTDQIKTEFNNKYAGQEGTISYCSSLGDYDIKYPDGYEISWVKKDQIRPVSKQPQLFDDIIESVDDDEIEESSLGFNMDELLSEFKKAGFEVTSDKMDEDDFYREFGYPWSNSDEFDGGDLIAYKISINNIFDENNKKLDAGVWVQSECLEPIGYFSGMAPKTSAKEVIDMINRIIKESDYSLDKQSDALIEEYYDVNSVAKEISNKLNLSAHDRNMLIHDINNLRGIEWLDQVKSIGDESLLDKFKDVAQLDLDEDIEKHDTLNPKLFDGEELKPEVRETIEKIANTFMEELANDGIKFKLKDIVLLGSNVSYNYTKDSDLDIHLVADSSDLHCPDDLYPLLYSAYRSMFNRNYDITIKGIPSEIYVEMDNVQAKSNGIYSLNSGWIKKPVQTNIPDLDKEAFDKLFTEWEDRYFDLIKGEDTGSDESLKEGTSSMYLDMLDNYHNALARAEKSGNVVYTVETEDDEQEFDTWDSAVKYAKKHNIDKIHVSEFGFEGPDGYDNGDYEEYEEQVLDLNKEPVTESLQKGYKIKLPDGSFFKSEVLEDNPIIFDSKEEAEDFINKNYNRIEFKDGYEIISEDLDESYRLDTLKTIFIPTGLSGKDDLNILNGLIGQLSDGMWENSSRMEKYWKYMDFKEGSNDEILIRVPIDYQWWLNFESWQDIRNWVARHLKAVVKEFIKDNPDSGAEWKRDCLTPVDYLRDYPVQDIYRIYDKLLQRKDRIEKDAYIESLHPETDLGWTGKGKRHSLDADTFTNAHDGDIIKIHILDGLPDLEYRIMHGSYLDDEAVKDSPYFRDRALTAEPTDSSADNFSTKLEDLISSTVKKSILDLLKKEYKGDFAYYRGGTTNGVVPMSISLHTARWDRRVPDILNDKDEVVESVLDEAKSDDIFDFITELYNLRKESIANEGEYGLGNLVFKEFRNLGYLNNLKRMRKDEKSKELSLESIEK